MILEHMVDALQLIHHIIFYSYALAGIENPLPLIMQDLNIRADRLADKLTQDDVVSSTDYYRSFLKD